MKTMNMKNQMNKMKQKSMEINQRPKNKIKKKHIEHMEMEDTRERHDDKE